MRVATALALLSLAACATRITGGVYEEGDGGSPPDLAQSFAPDLAQPPVDMSLPPDLAPTGKSCGDIVKCAIACGAQVGGCQLMCFQGASPQGLQEAGAVLACAAQNCLRGDGGAQSILLCLATSCGNQLSMCEGLGFP